jgi:hypothetical protein
MFMLLFPFPQLLDLLFKVQRWKDSSLLGAGENTGRRNEGLALVLLGVMLIYLLQNLLPDLLGLKG